MPLREYECADCGHVTEVLVRGEAPEKRTCEKCGSKEAERKLSAFSARVKAPSAGSAACESCPDGTCPFS